MRDGAVEEVFHGRRHVAEADGAAQGQSGTVFQFFGRAVGRAVVGDVVFHRFADGGDFGYGADDGFATDNAVDAACDVAGEVLRAAVLRIVQNQQGEGSWVHGGFPLE